MKFPLLNVKDFLNMIIVFWHLKFCGTFFNEYVTFSLKSQGKLGGFVLGVHLPLVIATLYLLN